MFIYDQNTHGTGYPLIPSAVIFGLRKYGSRAIQTADTVQEANGSFIGISPPHRCIWSRCENFRPGSPYSTPGEQLRQDSHSWAGIMSPDLLDIQVDETTGVEKSPVGKIHRFIMRSWGLISIVVIGGL